MISLFLQLLSMGLTTCVAGYALYTIRKRPVWLDDLIEEGSEMLFKPDETGKNVVDYLAERFGKGFRMSLLAQKSGEARHQKMIENRVFEAVKNRSPELKLGLKALEEFGLGDLATPENLPALLQIGHKYGLFGIFGNSPGKSPEEGIM